MLYISPCSGFVVHMPSSSINIKRHFICPGILLSVFTHGNGALTDELVFCYSYSCSFPEFVASTKGSSCCDIGSHSWDRTNEDYKPPN
jgi:hypothetical protein